MQVWAAEISAVHEEILIAEALLRCIRTTDITIEFHDGSLRMDVHNFLRHTSSEHILYPEFQGLCRTEDEYILSVMSEGESHIRTGKSHSCELRHYMLEFHIVRLKELASCRNIVEKVSDTEISSPRCCDFCHRHLLGIGELHLAADLILLSAGLESHLCHSRDGSQGLTTESEGHDIMQVLRRLEL